MKDFEMTPERYISLFKAAGVTKENYDELKVGFTYGPTVVFTEKGPLLLIGDPGHFATFNEHHERIEDEIRNGE